MLHNKDVVRNLWGEAVNTSCHTVNRVYFKPRTKFLGGKRYIMVMVDDFTRYIWVILLRSKSDALEHIEALCTRLQNENNLKIDRI